MNYPGCSACGGDDGYLRNTGTELQCGRCMVVHDRAHARGHAEGYAKAKTETQPLIARARLWIENAYAAKPHVDQDTEQLLNDLFDAFQHGEHVPRGEK